MKVPPRVAAVPFENKTKSLSHYAQQFTRNDKNYLNFLSLSEVELLSFLTLNLCGFHLGLEAGSR